MIHHLMELSREWQVERELQGLNQNSLYMETLLIKNENFLTMIFVILLYIFNFYEYIS